VFSGGLVNLGAYGDGDVPADILQEVLFEACEQDPRPRLLRIGFGRIVGRLDFESSTLPIPLKLSKCTVSEAIRLTHARLASLELYECELPALEGRGLHATGDFAIYGSRISGSVVLTGARIGGDLRLDGTELATDDEYALDADGVMVDRDLHLARGFRARSGVRIVGAAVGGEISLEGAELSAHEGAALAADHAHVGGGLYADGLEAVGGVSIAGANVAGQLALRGAALRGTEGRPALAGDALEVGLDVYCHDGFSASGMVRLLGATIGGELSFRGAELEAESGAALQGDGLTVGAAMYCDEDFTARGGVRLVDARISQALEFGSAKLFHESGPALAADGLVADSVRFDDNFRADGEIRLLHAKIAGELVFSSASLRNPGAEALSADRLSVGATLFLDDGFSASGAVRLTGAQVGNVNFAGAELNNEPDVALEGSGMRVTEGMTLSNGFHARGEVRLAGATVSGPLDLTGATLDGPRNALDLRDFDARSLVLRLASRPPGIIDLTGARVGRLIDQPYGGGSSWPRCRLRGFRYDALEPEPAVPIKSRLAWLATDPAFFEPQPFEQLANVLKQSGDEEGARRVLIEKQRARRKNALDGPAKAWSMFLGAAVGYGYRLWLAGVWLVALLVVWGLLFGVAFEASESGSADLTPASRSSEPAPFEPVLYAVDTLVPVLDLGQASSWHADGAAQWVAALGTVLGWLLTTAFLGGLVARRE
jgi:hypothetical protein